MSRPLKVIIVKDARKTDRSRLRKAGTKNIDPIVCDAGKMKVRVKFAGRAFPVEIADTASVEELKAVIASTLNIEHFSMSLNQYDFFDHPSNLSTTLQEQGIVNSDTVYVALREGSSETMGAYSPPQSPKPTATKPKPVAQALRAAASPSARTSSESEATMNAEQRPSSFKSTMETVKPQSAVEVVIVCIHSLLMDRGFESARVPEGSKKELPPNWRHGLAFNVVQLEYRHPRSDVPLQISALVQGQGERAFVAITASCVLGDTTQVRKVDLNFREFFADSTSATFKSPDSAYLLCQHLQAQLIEQLTQLVVGFDSPILNLPYDVKRKLIRKLPVTSFRKLSETCKELKKLWDDDSLWKHLLLRDFKSEAVAEAEQTDSTTRYKDCYKRWFMQLEERQRHRFDRTIPNPPPGVTDPYSSYIPPTNPGGIPGMVGGGYDLNPYGAFPSVHPSGGVWPHPGAEPPNPLSPSGPRQPFGPRIRPVSPFDPDAGLFGPRPPGRGSRNPFSGGPSFPRGRFL